ncbi:MAG: hypothetical protein ACU837_01780 [Gammaproteobacteria bacterium]
MIAFEIVITLFGALITVLIAIYQIQSNTMRRDKLDHSLEMLDLAQKLKCDETNFKTLIRERFEPFCNENQHPVASGAKFLTQELFDLVVFIGFGWWTFYLFGQDLVGWAIVAAIFALIGLMLTFANWRNRKQRNEAMACLRHGINSYVVMPAAAPMASPMSATTTAPIASAPPKSEKHAKTQTEGLAASDAKPKIPKTEAYPATSGISYVVKKVIEKVPEDSILKRHFLTTLRYEIELHMQPRPTDSILQRHYDHLLETELQMRLAEIDS